MADRYVALFDETPERERWIVADLGRKAVAFAYAYGDGRDRERAEKTADVENQKHEDRLAAAARVVGA